MTTLPPGMYPPPHTPHGTHQSQPVYGQQLLPGWEERVRRGRGGGDDGGSGTGGLGDVFDFSFGRYSAPTLVRILFAVVVVAVILEYVFVVMASFGIDLMVGLVLPFPPIGGVAALLLGWIPGALIILSARLSLEVALATVRTAVDARALRSRYVGPPVE